MSIIIKNKQINFTHQAFINLHELPEGAQLYVEDLKLITHDGISLYTVDEVIIELTRHAGYHELLAALREIKRQHPADEVMIAM